MWVSKSLIYFSFYYRSFSSLADCVYWVFELFSRSFSKVLTRWFRFSISFSFLLSVSLYFLSASDNAVCCYFLACSNWVKAFLSSSDFELFDSVFVFSSYFKVFSFCCLRVFSVCWRVDYEFFKSSLKFLASATDLLKSSVNYFIFPFNSSTFFYLF